MDQWSFSGLVDWEITSFEAQVLTYLIVVTGMSEIKDAVTYQFNLVRDHKYTCLLFYSYLTLSGVTCAEAIMLVSLGTNVPIMT